MKELEWPVLGRVRLVAGLAVALLGPALGLTLAGPGSGPRAAPWPTVGLAVLAAAWLTGVVFLCPRPTGDGSGRSARSWRAVYYAGLLVLLTGLTVWSPWFMLVSWTACVYAFLLFEARWAFFGAAAGGVALTAAQAGSLVPSSPEAVPLYVLSVVVPLLAGATGRAGPADGGAAGTAAHGP